MKMERIKESREDGKKKEKKEQQLLLRPVSRIGVVVKLIVVRKEAEYGVIPKMENSERSKQTGTQHTHDFTLPTFGPRPSLPLTLVGRGDKKKKRKIPKNAAIASKYE
eukprot:TRINITY_DN3489_c3_g2_i1.p1 TRINITY_DN3489_c3_g2~~TRINITY_DN3489_c3_g2_i1.p1  ORF type:complete len:108 (-),score=14.05 TRINITY_DN3489_c3_g2_i1:219-542(-)